MILNHFIAVCDWGSKDSIATRWDNEMVKKMFLMHCWLLLFQVFCSDRFCYSCVCWTRLCHVLFGISLVPNSCPAWLPPPYLPRPRCQMEMDMVCRLVPLWHEGVKHENRNLETAVNMLSAGKMCVLALQRSYSSNPIWSHSLRIGMDGHLCSDLPMLSSHCLGIYSL